MRRFSTSFGIPALGWTIKRERGEPHRLLDRAEQPVGADAAVHAPGDRLGTPGRQRGQHPLDRLAGGRFARCHDGERKHERHARQLPHRRRTSLQRRPIGLGLEEDEVGAAFDQTLRLLDDHLFDGRFVLRLDRRRTDRTGHVHRPLGRVGHLAGQPGAGAQDFGQLLGQRELGQRRPIGPERVGRQHVGPGVAILRMNLPNELRIGKAQFIEAAIREDVMPIDLGAHRPVEDEHAAGQGVLEGLVRHGNTLVPTLRVGTPDLDAQHRR